MVWVLKSGYHPHNQPYKYVQSTYNEPQFDGRSQGALDEVSPLTESHSKSDADLGVPENAPTE